MGDVFVECFFDVFDEARIKRDERINLCARELETVNRVKLRS